MAETPKILEKDTLRQAYPKLNMMVDSVNDFQNQLNSIVVEGDSSVEAAQARQDEWGKAFPTLKDRIDDINLEVANRGFNIKWLGAVGDGITDDTAIFQSFVDNVAYPKKLYVPKGVYVVNGLAVTRNLEIEGEEGAVLLAKTTTNGHTKTIFTAAGLDYLTVRNVEFDGNSTADTSFSERENMMKITSVKRVRFEDCEFHNHTSGEGGPLPTLLWSRDYIMSVIHNCDEVVIKHCEMHDNYDEQFLISSEDFRTVVDIQHNKAHTNSNSLALFILVNLKKGYVANNECVDNNRTFVNVLTSNVVIENNIVKNTTSRGIATEYLNIARSSNIVIRNNTLINCAQGAINLCGDNIIVEGNYIENCPGGIQISGQAFKDDRSADLALNPAAPLTPQNYNNIAVRNNTFVDIYGTGGFANAVRLRPELYIDSSNAYIYKKVQNVEITGNVLRKDTKAYSVATAVHVLRGENVFIANNTFEDTETYTFEFHISGHHFVIEKNKIKCGASSLFLFYFGSFLSSGKATYGLDFLSENITFRNNMITRNPVRCLIGVNGDPGMIKDFRILDNDSLFTKVTDYGGQFYNAPLTRRNYFFNSSAEVPSRVNLYEGDIINFTPTSGSPQYQIVKTSGTTGLLSSTTATTTSGSNTITVNDSSGLAVGNRIEITSISYTGWIIAKDGTSLTVSPAVNTATTGAAVGMKRPDLLNGPVLP
jgi:hypothetical protein